VVVEVCRVRLHRHEYGWMLVQTVLLPQALDQASVMGLVTYPETAILARRNHTVAREPADLLF
jgi:hypothetical protein